MDSTKARTIVAELNSTLKKNGPDERPWAQVRTETPRHRYYISGAEDEISIAGKYGRIRNVFSDGYLMLEFPTLINDAEGNQVQDWRSVKVHGLDIRYLSPLEQLAEAGDE